MHELAVLEMDLVEIAGNARSHLDEVEGDEAADIFVVVGDEFLDRLGDRHLGRRRGGRLTGRLLLPARRQRQGQESGRPERKIASDEAA